MQGDCGGGSGDKKQKKRGGGTVGGTKPKRLFREAGAIGGKGESRQ